MGQVQKCGWMAVVLCFVAATGCNPSGQSASKQEREVAADKDNGFQPTPPPRDTPPDFNGPGGGTRPVHCDLCPTYCSVPQYDSNGRVTGSKKVQ